MSLTTGYGIDNLTDCKIKNRYNGEVTIDHYGRKVPKHAHGTANLDWQASSSQIIRDNLDVQPEIELRTSSQIIKRVEGPIWSEEAG